MAGELSKKIGEEGEELATEFISKLGWIISAENINLDCERPPEHKKNNSERRTHGIDFIVAYECPLVPAMRRNILISMKNSHMEETKGQVTKVKDDLKELDWAMQCYKRSSLRADINSQSNATTIEDIGILIKINKDQDAAESFLRNLKGKERIDTSQNSELHFIENNRFDIVDVAINYLNFTRPKGQLTYFYPSTNCTYAADVAEVEGLLVPVQHLIASPLTYRYTEGELREFIVISPSEFSSGYLERLIGLAHGCSQGWAGKITVIFPSLTIPQKELAEKSLRGIKSKALAESVNVESLDIRSRTP